MNLWNELSVISKCSLEVDCEFSPENFFSSTNLRRDISHT